MRQTTLLLWVLVTLALTAWSCIDQLEDIGDINETRFEADYALPLIDSKITMNDLLEDFEENASLTVDPDGLLRFQYSGDVLTQNSLDVFASINETIDGIGTVPLLEKRQALPYAAPEGLIINEVRLKGTKMLYAISNEQSVPVTITLTLPTLVRDGAPFTISGEVPAWDGNGTPPLLTSGNDSVDLTDYSLTLDQDSIFIEVATIDADGNEYDPGVGSLMVFSDFSFSYAEGYLGNVVYEGGRDTIEIDFFDNWIQGDVFFENPKVTFNFENSFGIPTEALINVFNIVTAEGDILPLESVFIDEGGISFPFPAFDEVGEVKTAEFLFDTTNSNIDDVLGSKPVAIDYDVNALTNPDSNTAIIGFITDSSYYRVLVDVELPLLGWAENFRVLDTFELNLGDYDEIDAIEWKLITANGLPLAVDIQGVFLDENGNEVGQLLTETETLVGGAPVDAEGNPTSINETTTFIDWNADQVATVINANRLVLNASFGTTLGNTQNVRINSDQELEVRLGAIITVKEE